MIVDDSMIVRMNLKNILKQNGHEVVAEATNGEEACEMYELFKPDLVTMDITMPKMDGITALKNICTAHKDAAIIMISALGQEIRVLEALNIGAKHYILKPFNHADISEKVNSVLQNVS